MPKLNDDSVNGDDIMNQIRKRWDNYGSKQTLALAKSSTATEKADDGHKSADYQENVRARLVVERTFGGEQQRLVKQQPDR